MPVAFNPTRQKIYDYINHHPGATVDELSRTLIKTREAILYHLKQLIQQGLIDSTPITGSKHPGRPELHYRVHLSAQPNNYASLAEGLLDLYPLQEENAITLLAMRICPEPFAKSLTLAVPKLVNFLNQHAYEATWEARLQGPAILLRSCPYAAILASHPQLCQLDVKLMLNATRHPVKQVSKMDPFTRQPAVCLFQILSQPQPTQSSATTSFPPAQLP